VKTVVKFN